MLKKEFVEAVVNEVQQLLPGKEVSHQEIVKNNSVTLNGITIREPNQQLAPTIYIESYLNKGYERKGYIDEVKRIAKEIVKDYCPPCSNDKEHNKCNR
jgi:hypothetical protein